MKVFLTGGNGMVGRNLLEQSEAKTFEFYAPNRATLDLFNVTAVEQAMADFKPDIVVHAAGTVGGIQANIREPLRFFVENLDMGKNVLAAADKLKVPRVINLGSSCMYPRAHKGKLTEDLVLTGELEPTNEGYALAKIAVQRMGSYLNADCGSVRFKTLIPCNLFGRWDKFSPEHSHLIPGVMKRLHDAKIQNLPEVEVWGDGTARREFMFASDFAAGLVQAIKRFDSLPAVMNMGLGYDYSINQYYTAIANAVGFEGQFRHDLSKPVGMIQKLCDVQKQTAWGWQAPTSLEDGIAKTFQFYQENAVS